MTKTATQILIIIYPNYIDWYCFKSDILGYNKPDEFIQQIPINMLKQVMSNPQAVVPAANNRKCYQAIYLLENQKKYLIRIITEEKEGQLLVITVYKTSKIGKYIKEES